MRYVELELAGYKRLHLANIAYIKITPQEKLQLLLGTNGSGKVLYLKNFHHYQLIHKTIVKMDIRK